MHPGASSPAERGDFDASIHTLGAIASKLGVGPSKMLATRKAGIPSPSPNPFKCPGSLGEERGDRPMDRDPFCEFGEKGCGNGITVNIAVTPPPNLALSVYLSSSQHADLEKELLLHRAHTLTDLSVTKPRPRPGNFVEATPLVSNP